MNDDGPDCGQPGIVLLLGGITVVGFFVGVMLRVLGWK